MRKKSSEATISDVARHAGVSLATVSRVLNDKSKVRRDTAEKVSRVMESLSYIREPVHGHEKNQLLIAVLPNLDNPFYAEIIKGIRTSAKSHGMSALIFPEPNVDRDYSQLIRLVETTRASGVILLSPVNQLETLAALGAAAPLVQCAEYTESSPFPYVGVDDTAAAKMATEALIRVKRRRIALINGPEKYKYARHRYQGYAQALFQAGLEVNPSLVANVTEMGFDSSLAVARQMLLSAEHPDAIFAASDMYAAAVIKAADQAAIHIPEQLSVIGFDNTYISQMLNPSVSSVSIPRFQLGYTAGELLMERIQNPVSMESKHILLKTELVLRDSV